MDWSFILSFSFEGFLTRVRLITIVLCATINIISTQIPSLLCLLYFLCSSILYQSMMGLISIYCSCICPIMIFIILSIEGFFVHLIVVFKLLVVDYKSANNPILIHNISALNCIKSNTKTMKMNKKRKSIPSHPPYFLFYLIFNPNPYIIKKLWS